MAAASDLLPLLKRHWGFDRFRPFQADAAQAVLDGRDSVVVLPTGGGKSLCFQAPALFLDGLAIVVSPDPMRPNTPTRSPALMARLKPASASISCPG